MELWGGRFSKSPDQLALEFGASIDVDRRLYREDIMGSMAHARMLARQGIIESADGRAILLGLVDVLREIESGAFTFRLDREDIHANVEGRLRELIGEAAGRLHTGRSRNDQVALDTRLWTRRALVQVAGFVVDLQAALIEQARAHTHVAMPGYTHLQRAQPVLVGHHLHAYVEMLQRDLERIRDAYVRVNMCPLGSGALAGVPYPIDRAAVARDLGFDGVTENSMDAVSDRDFVVETLSACALIAVHLSRLSEEIVLWASSEFQFITLDDAFSTGSSIMPQKKNPDPAELVRGKTGRVFGDLLAVLTILKGTPLAYNKDFQEDKSALFDGIDTVSICLSVLAPLIRTSTFNRPRLAEVAGANHVLATDFADHLTRLGVPFRRAHEVVGKLVALCLTRGCELADLSLEELRQAAPEFSEAVTDINVMWSINAREVPGGTAANQVAAALDRASERLNVSRAWIERTLARLPDPSDLVEL